MPHKLRLVPVADDSGNPVPNTFGIYSGTAGAGRTVDMRLDTTATPPFTFARDDQPIYGGGAGWLQAIGAAGGNPAQLNTINVPRPRGSTHGSDGDDEELNDGSFLALNVDGRTPHTGKIQADFRTNGPWMFQGAVNHTARIPRSGEHIDTIPNDGYIDNLPAGCCVEVPVYVDGAGFHPARVGQLPPGCAALNMSNVMVQGLAVEGALSGDPDLLAQAMAIDPLTSTKCTLAEARQMASELIQAQARWLPQFAGRLPKPTPAIVIPAGTQGVDVPTDPALAVANRFGDLANRKV